MAIVNANESHSSAPSGKEKKTQAAKQLTETFQPDLSHWLQQKSKQI